MLLYNSTVTVLCLVILQSLVIGDPLRNAVGSEKTGGATCKTRKECFYRGECEEKGDSNVCNCFEGVRGENCNVIKECVDNNKFCGAKIDVKCEYDPSSRKPFCECKGESRRFDVEQKKCVDQKPCLEHSDCSNFASCNSDYQKKSSEKYCHCVHGTSGDFCKRIAECVDNPSLCEEGKDVECRFNSMRERAYCHCKNGTQRFDLKQKKCIDRRDCRVNDECLPFGRCTARCQEFEPCSDSSYFEGKRSCHCIEGTSGENCEIVDDCYNKEVDCGTSDKVVCSYLYVSGFKGKAYCKCKDPLQEFDKISKTCKDTV